MTLKRMLVMATIEILDEIPHMQLRWYSSGLGTHVKNLNYYTAIKAILEGQGCCR